MTERTLKEEPHGILALPADFEVITVNPFGVATLLQLCALRIGDASTH
jgi:hypothetical protein